MNRLREERLILRILLGFVLATASCNERPEPPAPEPAPAPAPESPEVSGPKLLPVDEGGQDPSFAKFREQLLDIVRRRDASALLKVVNPQIRTSFGPEGGIEDFRKHWKAEDPHSPLWSELEFILTHGGKHTPEQFWAPYVYSAWPEAIDAFEYVAAIDKDVPLRESKSGSAKSIAGLSYDIVKREEEQDGWTRVTTKDGRTGWVESKSVRSPIDYRAGFVKKGDKWELDLLVAGD